MFRDDCSRRCGFDSYRIHLPLRTCLFTATKRTTHEMNIKNSKVKADFGRFKIITINIQPDYLITLEDKVEHITDILNHEMKSSLKFYISAYVKINLDGGKSGLSAAAERRRRRVILPRRTPPIHPGVHRRTACIF